MEHNPTAGHRDVSLWRFDSLHEKTDTLMVASSFFRLPETLKGSLAGTCHSFRELAALWMSVFSFAQWLPATFN